MSDVILTANSLIWAMPALNKFRIQAVRALKEYEVFILKVWEMYVEWKLCAADHYFPLPEDTDNRQARPSVLNGVIWVSEPISLMDLMVILLGLLHLTWLI